MWKGPGLPFWLTTICPLAPEKNDALKAGIAKKKIKLKNMSLVQMSAVSIIFCNLPGNFIPACKCSCTLRLPGVENLEQLKEANLNIRICCINLQTKFWLKLQSTSLSQRTRLMNHLEIFIIQFSYWCFSKLFRPMLKSVVGEFWLHKNIFYLPKKKASVLWFKFFPTKCLSFGKYFVQTYN